LSGSRKQTPGLVAFWDFVKREPDGERRFDVKGAGEDETFPQDQFYNPPEDELVSSKDIHEDDDERVEVREHRFTKLRVTLRDENEIARVLIALRLNPRWYPHGIYAPADATSGGPFAIGRVIHSSRSVGFTGWIE